MKVLKCGGNMYVILVYDINLENKEGQRVLRNVFKTCKKYLVHIQNSVFEADLDYSSFLKLKEKLMDLIDKEEDSLRFYYLGNNWKRRVEHIGAKKTYNPEGVIII